MPVEVVDISGAYFYCGQLGITTWAGYRTYLGVGGVGTWFYDDDDEPIVTFDHYAARSGLVVDAQGVGVGHCWSTDGWPRSHRAAGRHVG